MANDILKAITLKAARESGRSVDVDETGKIREIPALVSQAAPKSNLPPVPPGRSLPPIPKPSGPGVTPKNVQDVMTDVATKGPIFGPLHALVKARLKNPEKLSRVANYPAKKSAEGLKMITDAIPDPQTRSVPANVALGLPKAAAEEFAKLSAETISPAGLLATKVPPAVRKGTSRLVQKYKEPIKEKLGAGIDALGSLQAGSGRTALGAPEITKPGHYTGERAEEFVNTLGTRLQEFSTAIKDGWKRAAQRLDAAKPGGKIPTEGVYERLSALKDTLKVQKPGVQRLSPQTSEAIAQIEKEIFEDPDLFKTVKRLTKDGQGLLKMVETKVPVKQMTLQKAIELRQRLDRLADFSASGPGSGVDANAIKPLRSYVDGLVAQHYPGFKKYDRWYAGLIKRVKDLEGSFGIKAGKSADDLGTKDLQRIESKLLNSLRKGELERESLKDLSKRRRLGYNALNEAEKLAASGAKLGKKRQFEKLLRPGVATFGTGILGGAAAVFNPMTLLFTAPALAATSPRLLGAAIRSGSRNAAALGQRGGAAVKAAQLGGLFAASRRNRNRDDH
jgi:hypothetical protein